MSGSPLSRDAVWSVLQWLPWYEQLRVRRVCRTWCRVVHENLTTMPYEHPCEALPALLRCNLRELDLDAYEEEDVLAMVQPNAHALPLSLRELVMCSGMPLGSLTRLAQLESLTLKARPNGDALGDDDVSMLGALTTLTQLAVEAIRCSMEVASRSLAALTALRDLSLLSCDLLCDDQALDSNDDAMAQLLRHTPPSLEAIRVLHMTAALPLEHWTQLRSLDVEDTVVLGAQHELLGRLAAVSSLHRLALRLGDSITPELHELRALTTLRELRLTHFPPRRGDFLIAVQLAPLVYLTKIMLRYVALSTGCLQALAGLASLRVLTLASCHGPSVSDLTMLTQLRELALGGCSSFQGVMHLPVTIEVLRLRFQPEALPQLGRGTLLRRLELSECDVGVFDVRASWGSLRLLREILIANDQTLPRNLLFDLSATLPALQWVQVVNCSPLDSLPPPVQVCVLLYPGD